MNEARGQKKNCLNRFRSRRVAREEPFVGHFHMIIMGMGMANKKIRRKQKKRNPRRHFYICRKINVIPLPSSRWPIRQTNFKTILHDVVGTRGDFYVKHKEFGLLAPKDFLMV